MKLFSRYSFLFPCIQSASTETKKPASSNPHLTAELTKFKVSSFVCCHTWFPGIRHHFKPKYQNRQLDKVEKTFTTLSVKYRNKISRLRNLSNHQVHCKICVIGVIGVDYINDSAQSGHYSSSKHAPFIHLRLQAFRKE